MERDDTLRFVVQEHHTPDGVHWDLMIAVGDRLRTWRMDCAPADIRNAPLPLVEIADHPLRFLTYEGPVQNNTGRVTICDRGRVVIKSHSDKHFRVVFSGNLLNGSYHWTRNADGPLWTFYLSP